MSFFVVYINQKSISYERVLVKDWWHLFVQCIYMLQLYYTLINIPLIGLVYLKRYYIIFICEMNYKELFWGVITK